MSDSKSKGIEKIEHQMERVKDDPFRLTVLESAKKFKTSWIELGRLLFEVKQDHRYRDWEYGSFEDYCAREIGIRKQTAAKLVRSYYFLEKEEPVFLNRFTRVSPDVRSIPSFESVDLLRSAKQRNVLSQDDYEEIKEDALEKGTQPQIVKRYILQKQKPVDPSGKTCSDPKSVRMSRCLMLLGKVKNELSSLPRVPRSLFEDLDHIGERIKELLR